MIIINRRDKIDQTYQFIVEVGKLTDIEFMGLCKLLKVDVVEDVEVRPPADGEDNKTKHKSRPFEDIIVDIIDSFAAKPRKFRKQLYKLVVDSNKKRVSREESRAAAHEIAAAYGLTEESANDTKEL